MVRHRKQVALLAPTTILAAQHYRINKKDTYRYRFSSALVLADFILNTRAKERNILHLCACVYNFFFDIAFFQVVGTHSLLSRKVEFPNLGLLVIDEEQKFGVNQKEKLKVS
ncbi:unnamed protein product [Scytosiphon promiscuus]